MATAASALLGLCLASTPTFAEPQDTNGHANTDGKASKQHADGGHGQDNGNNKGKNQNQAPHQAAKPSTGAKTTFTRGAPHPATGAAQTQAQGTRSGHVRTARQNDPKTPAIHESRPNTAAATTNRTTQRAASNGVQHNEANASGNRRRTNVGQYQRNENSPHRFRAAAYRAPRGYSYRQWTYGERLPAMYFGRDYWLSDFLTYELFAPPEGYVWVRYGPDALLVDEDSGEIIQVRYNVFY